jgi:hypothetical protein
MAPPHILCFDWNFEVASNFRGFKYSDWANANVSVAMITSQTVLITICDGNWLETRIKLKSPETVDYFLIGRLPGLWDGATSFTHVYTVLSL